jgi:cobalt-zinc-cadmium efflux system protein
MAHDHSHNHSHEIHNYNRAFAIGIALNVVFVVVEIFYGTIADSLALIADAGHNFSDVISLLLAWGAGYLATKSPTKNRTYGFRRVTILASLTSAVLLLVALGGITWEAFGRLLNPPVADGMTIIIVAGIGVVINTVTALLFISGQKHDLNIRGAYLHMAADAGISFGVVIAGIAIMYTGWLWLDPALSIAIVLIILVSTWHLLKESISLSIDAVPQGIDISEIRAYLTGLNQISEIHDLHVWALSTTETALTVHLVTTSDYIDDNLLQTIQQHLHDQFDIEHATIQIENEAHGNVCALNRPECVQ